MSIIFCSFSASQVGACVERMMLSTAERGCAGLTCHNAHGAKEVRREAAVLKGLLPTDYKCAPCTTSQNVLQRRQQHKRRVYSFGYAI